MDKENIHGQQLTWVSINDTDFEEFKYLAHQGGQSNAQLLRAILDHYAYDPYPLEATPRAKRIAGYVEPRTLKIIAKQARKAGLTPGQAVRKIVEDAIRDNSVS